MTDVEHRTAARQFATDWQSRGDEKQETQQFWMTLLQNVYGMEQPAEIIGFEKRVEVVNNDGTTTTKYIDGYIPATRVLLLPRRKIGKKRMEEKTNNPRGIMLEPTHK